MKIGIIRDLIDGGISKIKKIKDRDYKNEVLRKFDSLKDFLVSKLDEIYNRLPGKNVNNFYKELFDLYIGWENIIYAKKRIRFVRNKIIDFYSVYKNRIRILKKREDIRKVSKEFYGRVFSLLRRNKKAFAIYEEVEKLYRNMPKIKALPTIVITGLPNVGKSTLLKELTGSKPEIGPYPFTTKDIMIGYIRLPYTDVQILDVPGILDREFDRMNVIEKRAVLALRYLANLIVYVFDITETCGYSVEEQENVFNRIRKNFKIETILYFSKVDLFSNENWNKMKEIGNKYNVKYFYDPKSLRNYIESFIKEKKLFV